jgi:hypothetical protein
MRPGEPLMDWKYQLVVQFPSDGDACFERVLDLERRIGAGFGSSLPAEIAGHGTGHGEINLFIFTDLPEAACGRIHDVTDKDGSSRDYRVAYRDLGGDDWIVLWPADRASFHEPATDWRYRLILEYPLAEGDGGDFRRRVNEVAAWINGALGDGPEAVFDGEWLGSEAMGMAVLTDTPEATFQRLRALIDEHAPRADYQVAYCRFAHDDPFGRNGRTVLWHGSADFGTSSRPFVETDPPTDLRYQLVVQFRSEDDRDVAALHRLTDLEERIDAVLPDESNDIVDGHDMGSGEMNIFIFTNTPAETFRRIQPLIGEHGPRADYRAAYRDVRGDSYTILWPEDLTEFDVI